MPSPVLPTSLSIEENCGRRAGIAPLENQDAFSPGPVPTRTPRGGYAETMNEELRMKKSELRFPSSTF